MISDKKDYITQDKKQVYKICLTGGPCGGKTSSVDYLRKKFEAHGFKVFVVTEIATTTINNGCLFYEYQEYHAKKRFNYHITKLQLDMEQYYLEAANIEAEFKNNNVLIICDRGVLDNWSYITRDIRSQIENEREKFSDYDLQLNRYDGVFHMMTAAALSENAYNTMNVMEGRIECNKESLLLDKKNMYLYLQEENFNIVGNPEGFSNCKEAFEKKQENLFISICQQLNLSHLFDGIKFAKLINMKKVNVVDQGEGMEKIDWSTHCDLVPLSEDEKKEMKIMGNANECQIWPGYFDVTEEILVINVKNQENNEDGMERKLSTTWIMKRKQDQDKVMYYLNERKYSYGPPSAKAVWPLGFWDSKKQLSEEQFYLHANKLKKQVENQSSEIGNYFIKEVRKFIWEGCVYKLELVNGACTLVSEFSAKLPVFLKL